MSLHTLPILFFNLGGEMLYILDQRLRAQNVPQKKAVKVLRDIVGQMFDIRCVSELFRPQKVFSKKSLRTVFDRLAHASIMKLNSNAMDKLYDLMVMAAKYQILLCPRAEDVLLVTFNHLDTIRALIDDGGTHTEMLNAACKMVTQHYGKLGSTELILLRATLLSAFQDTHKRVSVFLKSEAQQPNGRFFIPLGGPVPTGYEVPGVIRYFNDEGEKVGEEEFSPLSFYEPAQPAGSWGVKGDRVITLGTNMYAADKNAEPVKAADDPGNEAEETSQQAPGPEGDPLVKAELQLLEKLLVGIRELPSSEDSFKLSLFSDEDDDSNSTSKCKTNASVLQISPSKKGKDELNKIMEDLTLQQTSEGTPDEDQDLLDLMDSVS